MTKHTTLLYIHSQGKYCEPAFISVCICQCLLLVILVHVSVAGAQVNGEQQLRKTTLRDLGLSGGHAAVRLVYHLSQEKTSDTKQSSLEQEGSFKNQEGILKQEVAVKGESHEENENMDVGKSQSEQNMSPSAMSIEEESNVTLHDPHLQDTPMLLLEPAVKPVDRGE